MEKEKVEEKKDDVTEELKEAVSIEKQIEESMEISLKTSDNIGQIASALANAQGVMINGVKSKSGYGYKYMPLDDLINIVRSPLSSNKIALIQTNDLNKTGNAPTVIITTLLMHESGEWIKTELEIPIHNMKQLTKAQMIGVASTYGRRYSIQSMCLIASEEDTDGTIKES